mmetsp:Transcript_28270/g.79067  ORF Transcript_28270/g.79067 Transcript_28270/m.79067 type:complete len:145 (-) Transcript_28270:29-463(-)|eukprot:CAMPEP_0119119718 /NCGR_PEP_ID=MMETSP1310-20130426/1086_1 /TAXON_ID=464262 /ORGANISM="Genus nov. species nov., Strain RCC2339" /LENGTH=144 /DNA_ID=CAMNT_0007109165 /DNA_START=88 /DNA_END=522 /DNA_ORIENTATION=+
MSMFRISSLMYRGAAASLTRRGLATTVAVRGGDVKLTPAEEAAQLQDEIAHATGDEKAELFGEEESRTDLFGKDALSGKFGTPAEPCLVPSSSYVRFVACVGPMDHEHDLRWHRVYEDKPTVCMECGQFFKLDRSPYPAIAEEE